MFHPLQVSKDLLFWCLFEKLWCRAKTQTSCFCHVIPHLGLKHNPELIVLTIVGLQTVLTELGSPISTKHRPTGTMAVSLLLLHIHQSGWDEVSVLSKPLPPSRPLRTCQTLLQFSRHHACMQGQLRYDAYWSCKNLTTYLLRFKPILRQRYAVIEFNYSVRASVDICSFAAYHHNLIDIWLTLGQERDDQNPIRDMDPAHCGQWDAHSWSHSFNNSPVFICITAMSSFTNHRYPSE